MQVVPLAKVIKILPERALEYFATQFSPAQYNMLLLSFREKRATTFRVNSLLTDATSVQKKLLSLGFKVQPLQLIENGFITRKNCDKEMLKSDLVRDGSIYLQGISSMLPPLILSPLPGERILDLAAAPGSKTTQLAALIGDRGRIDAVEPDFIRFERLKANLKTLHVECVDVHQTRGELFCRDKENVYDRVLLDAPCSGEGRFSIYDKSSYGGWSEKEITRLAKLQKKLLAAAFNAVKPGGTLVYATCTLNIRENEMVIQSLLEREGDRATIESISRRWYQLPGVIKPFAGFETVSFSSQVNRCLRMLPSKQMEGFFIGRIRKTA